MSDPQSVLVSGQPSEALGALRSLLAASLASAEPREVAALSKEYRAVLESLERVRPSEVSASDDLASRRQARRAGAQAAHPSGDGGDVSRPGSS